MTSPLEKGAASPSRRSRRRWLWYSLLALPALLLVAVLVGYLFVRRSLPTTDGEVTIKGLEGEVVVYRDARGVPHIEARTSHDLFLAQGYVTAQDRLWQMDFTRRAGSGRLSEVLGKDLVGADKFLRSLLLRRSAEASVAAPHGEWARTAAEAYIEGVNAFIDQAKEEGSLPLEFTILGYEPEPWTLADSLSISKLMAYDLGGDFSGEVFRYQLVQAVGEELAEELFPVYPEDGITIMHYQARGASRGEQGAELSEAVALARESSLDLSGLLSVALWPDEVAGSNNWVVSGKKTASGKPLLANDPHLALRTPAIWYQTHLVLLGEEEKMNVIGVTFPGAPGIVLGHNDRIAWGVTNTGPDVQDLYIEKRNPENPQQFEFQGKWEDATVYEETIKVKDEADVPFAVVVTRHGPIISEVVGGRESHPEEALALKWTAHLPTQELEAVLGFDRATSWSEFREALKQFQAPTQNFVFASDDGTIAYHAAGLVPLRAKGKGLLPVPGWTGEYEWTGFIPFDEMPEVVNPEEGFIATANDKVVDDAYPYFISSSWAEPYRAMRITEVLESKGGFTADDMRLLQGDFTNLQARTLLPILLGTLEGASLGAPESASRELLSQWDFVDGAEQAAPLVYHLWWKHFRRELYEPTMGPNLYSRMEDEGNVTGEMLRRAAKGNEGPWLSKVGGLEALGQHSFQAAVAEAVRLQGQEPSSWRWGDFHQIGPLHPIGKAVAILGWFLNPAVYPVGGSGQTVAAMHFDEESGAVSHSAPWRHVADLADLSGGSYDIVSPGQSGHFLSPFYQDQAALHASGQLLPQNASAEAYRDGQKLVLKGSR